MSFTFRACAFGIYIMLLLGPAYAGDKNQTQTQNCVQHSTFSITKSSDKASTTLDKSGSGGNTPPKGPLPPPLPYPNIGRR